MPPVAAALAAAGLASAVALHPVLGQPKALLAVGGVVAGAAAFVVTVAKFEYGVLAVLAARPSLDPLQRFVGERIDVPALLGAGFVLAAALWLLIQPRVLPGAGVERAGTALVVALVVATIGSTMPAAGVGEIAGVAAAVLMFAVARRLLRDWGAISRLLAAGAVSAVIPLGVGLYQVVTQRGLYYSSEFASGRVAGPFVHPSPFAAYLVVVGLMGLALLPLLKAWVRVPACVCLLALAACLVSTYTRGAWLAAVAGAAVIAVLHSRWLVVGLAVVLVAAAVAAPNVTARLADLRQENLDRLDWEVPQNSLAWRVGYWKQLLADDDRPLLTGNGPGTAGASTAEGLAPHNDFLKAYVEAGVLGLLAYLGFTGSLVALAIRGLRNITGRARAIAAGFAGVVTAFVLMSAVDNLLSQLVVMWFVAAFGAVAWAAQRVGVLGGVR